ncbi:Mariner Mos1 transposase [Eumeta japonica]|uniref:Mariner Mos1 transposase n=1 Tax=Eumeta variegata TaxID=151549 RepID=A0A4C1TZ56_EUMVA|nr:Mariner Mos1 transposase [Eumeta japonica]
MKTETATNYTENKFTRGRAGSEKNWNFKRKESSAPTWRKRRASRNLVGEKRDDVRACYLRFWLEVCYTCRIKMPVCGEQNASYPAECSMMGVIMECVREWCGLKKAALSVERKKVPHNLSIDQKQSRDDWRKNDKKYNYYASKADAVVFEEIRKNNRQHRIIFHHDNASCHTSTETTWFLEGQKIELPGHPQYSPDSAPNDFYLFPSAKNKLRGQHFSCREEAVDAFKMHVLEIPQSEWRKRRKNWFQQLQKCIDHHGEYFEKQQ